MLYLFRAGLPLTLLLQRRDATLLSRGYLAPARGERVQDTRAQAAQGASPRITEAMNVSRIALITAASGFFGFGAACLLRPKNMLNRIDVRPKSAVGTTELRAMYGGLELGLGAFFAVAAANEAWSRPALMAQSLSLGALAVSRLTGILVDRPRGRLMKALCIAECAAAGLGVAALARRREKTYANLRAA
jgi:hypothetical protein